MLRFKPIISGIVSGLLHKNCTVNRLQSAQKRYVFNPANFRIPSFEKDRETMKKFFRNPDDFKENLRKSLEENENYLVFIDDIKKLTYLTETDEDIELLTTALQRFGEQTNVIRFQAFNVGPLVMRLFYVLNKPQEALEMVKCFGDVSIFKESVTFIILSGLLYKNEMYNEVINLFHWIKLKQIQGRIFIKPVTTLYFASCYKINTTESFLELVKTWNILNDAGVKINYKCTCIFAMFSLKQNKASVALNCFFRPHRNSLGLNIEILALAQENRFNNVIDSLRLLLDNDSLEDPYLAFDVYNALEEHFQLAEESERNSFNIVAKKLEAAGIIADKCLDEYLLAMEPTLPIQEYGQKAEFLSQERAKIIKPQKEQKDVFSKNI